MKTIRLALMCVFCFGTATQARLGETPEQCEVRYGQALTNYPGHGPVESVAVYGKDGISISAFFVRQSSGNAQAGMMLYSRLNPMEGRSLFIPPALSEQELQVLLNTVDGRWQEYQDNSPALSGRPQDVKTMSTQPSITIANRDATAGVVRKAVDAMYSPRVLYSVYRRVQNIAHNGPRIFAFHVARGVALCSHDAIAPIEAWAERILEERERAKNQPQDTMQGF